MKEQKRFLVIGLFCVITAIASATLEISVATDKPDYQIGEIVNISISVFNTGQTPETLYGSFYFTTYIMDGIYNWALGRSGPEVILQVTLLPGETKVWEMTHGYLEMQEFPLSIGAHSVIGGAGFNLVSEPVTFQVIPEPATFLLIGTGYLLLRRKSA
jgi:hypothetical protein